MRKRVGEEKAPVARDLQRLSAIAEGGGKAAADLVGNQLGGIADGSKRPQST